MALSLGVTYTFYITTQNGVTHFSALQGSTEVWSLDAPTGGDHLVLSYAYSGYYNYTNYEEVWQTSTPGGSPAFDFYFYNNYWISTGGIKNAATWDTFFASAPSNVAVVVDGDAVLVDNPPQPDFTISVSPTSGSVNVGGSTSTTITTSPVNGFSSTVSLSISGLSDFRQQWYYKVTVYPGGNVCYIWSNSYYGQTYGAGSGSHGALYEYQNQTRWTSISTGITVTLPTSGTRDPSGTPTFSLTMTVSTSSSTPKGTYTITVTGTGGGLTRSCTYKLTVT